MYLSKLDCVLTLWLSVASQPPLLVDIGSIASLGGALARRTS